MSDVLKQTLQDREKAPEVLEGPTAERAVKILDGLKEKVKPKILALLCHPNIVLTLTGARAQTEDYILHPTEEDRTALEHAAGVLQEYGITVLIEDEIDRRTYDNAEILGFFMIDFAILAEASRSTKIPGILPFDPSSGVEGMQAWMQDCIQSLDAQKRDGALDQRIGADDYMHIVAGIAKGYPDKAILSFMVANQESESDKPVLSSDIAHADEYQCPEPNYGYGEELADDPDILAHQKLWGDLLAGFYGSRLHQEISADPRYRALLSKQ